MRNTYSFSAFPVSVLVLSMLLAGQIAHAQPILQRGGPVDQRPEHDVHLSVGAGVLVDDFDESRFALVAALRWTFWRSARSRLDLALPIYWASGTEDSLDCLPDCLDDPEGDGTFAFTGDIEADATYGLAPSLEWTRATDCCFSVSIFLGAGIQHDRGPTVRSGDLLFVFDDATSPLVTFGLALERPLTRDLALRLEARGNTVFSDDSTVGAEALGIDADFEGETRTSLLVTLGLQWGF